MKRKDDSLSLAEAAVLAGKCIETIYRLVRSQRIEAKKDADGNWRISREAVLAYYGKRAAEARLPERHSSAVAAVAS